MRRQQELIDQERHIGLMLSYRLLLGAQEVLTGSNDCQIMVWSPQGDTLPDERDSWSDGFESSDMMD